ncbi:putative toxin [Asticcacaulis solisilvae]|uniref:putative toxin n=1 Tax=Asticcacaulis solisilvae TaxID=1217274 RepID=UPI003FD76D19
MQQQALTTSDPKTKEELREQGTAAVLGALDASSADLPKEARAQIHQMLYGSSATGNVETQNAPVSQSLQAQDVTVTGEHDRILGKTGDHLAIQFGGTVKNIEGSIDTYLNDHPAQGAAVEFTSTALTVIGGPVRFAEGQVWGFAHDAVKGGIKSAYDGAKYTESKPSDASEGIVTAGDLVLGVKTGVGVVKSLASVTGGIFSALKRTVTHAPVGLGEGPSFAAPPAAESGEPLLLTGPKQISLNKADGGTFQNAVQDSLRMTENRQAVTVTLADGRKVTTIPDLWGAQSGVLDIKKVQSLSFTEQLRAQYQLALDGGQSFNLVVSPGTKTISLPLQRSVAATGGKIFEFNPTTGSWTNVVLKGNKVVRP